MSAILNREPGLHLLNIIQSVNPVYGGPAEGLRQLCRATLRLGQHQDVLTLDAPGAPWLRDFPSTIHAVGPRVLNYGYARGLAPWLQAHVAEYDAVIVHGLWQYHGLATWRALRGGRVPYFVFPHGMLDPWFRHRYPLKHLKKWLYWPWAEYRVLRDASGVLFTTAEEARLASQSFALYRARAVNLGYGLALEEDAIAARAEDLLAAFPALRGCRLLLFLGRLHPKKGCDLLIEAYARVAARDPALHLVLAGPDSGHLRADLGALAARLGVADRITWTGMLEGRQKWGALRAAEVFVLSSHQENFGIAVAEALAVGLPVLVSTQVNIWREIVADGAGFGAPDTLAGTLELLQRWLALDPPARLQMQERARTCFAQRFHIDAAARSLLELLASNRRAASQP
jgi:glycosyltransferase involved in cell wall biosynthesis